MENKVCEFTSVFYLTNIRFVFLTGCSFKLDRQNLGINSDPAYGCAKSYNVEYECKSGETPSMTFARNFAAFLL